MIPFWMSRPGPEQCLSPLRIELVEPGTSSAWTSPRACVQLRHLSYASHSRERPLGQAATRAYTAATPKAPLSLLPTPAGATPLSIAASARLRRPP